jgi:hypothetical protein
MEFNGRSERRRRRSALFALSQESIQLSQFVGPRGRRWSGRPTVSLAQFMAIIARRIDGFLDDLRDPSQRLEVRWFGSEVRFWSQGRGTNGCSILLGADDVRRRFGVA